MKQKLLMACAITLSTINLQAQTIVQEVPANTIAPLTTNKNIQQKESLVKTYNCIDTISYTYIKQAIIGGGTGAGQFGGTLLSQAQGYRISQAYLNGGSMNITGVEFVGAVYTANGGPAVITANASIYSIDASNNPVTLLGSGSVSMNNTASYAFTYVNFAAPIAVTGNYAIVIDIATPGGEMAMYRNNATPGQSQDENLSRITATPLAGAWMSISALSSGAQDWEGIIGPIVSYPVTSSYTVATTPACLGQQVVFTKTSTPAGVLASRMNNFYVFLNHFLPGTNPVDSTYTWDLGNSTIAAGPTLTYTYPAAGTYTVELDTKGGFLYACNDQTTQTVVINALPAAPTVTPSGPLTYCINTPTAITSSQSNGNTWSNTATSASISPTTSGNYSVTYTDGNGCTSAPSNVVAITVNPAEDGSFTYPSYNICTGSANVTPTAALAGGTYSSTPAGLVINAATGEIDVTNSADGSYSVTYTTAGSCAGSSSHTVVISSSPDASFNYTAGTYCSVDADPSPTFGAGATAGTFSSTTGLVINSSTGLIDLSASTAGTYVVTNTIAASGSCPMADATQTIVINSQVTSDFAPISSYCSGASIPALPTTSTNGISGTWSPAINNTATTTYTFTPDAGECGTSVMLAITIDQPVTPTFPTPSIYCSGSAIPALPTTSTNGITGVWSPAINNTATTTYTFTPDGSVCANTAQVTIVVVQPTAPTFTAIDNICQNDAAPALPATSNNGVPGTWNPATISTATIGTTTYTFTPTSGQCATTATLDVVIDDCAGLDESNITDFNVFPNPTNDVITISFSALSDVVMTVITNDGKLYATKLIKGGNGVSETLDMSMAANGIYFINLSSTDGSIIRKVVKQ